MNNTKHEREPLDSSPHGKLVSRIVMHGSRSPRRWARAAALAAAGLLTGCAMTPLVWTKAGIDEPAARADLDECRLLAVDQMWRMTWESSWPPSFYDPLSMPPYYRGARPFWIGVPDSLKLEQSLTEFCMHSKGYRLGRSPNEPR